MSDLIEEAVIAGYGSLMNTTSRSLTESSSSLTSAGSPAVPARISGFSRLWCAFERSHYSPLGIIESEEAAVNVVLFNSTRDRLINFDKRETNYTRVSVPASSVFLVNENRTALNSVEIYVPNSTFLPYDDAPIVQSYVDVVVSGCLEHSEAFAREFVTSTLRWDAPWVNDRESLRYRRTTRPVDSLLAKKIDSLLEECLLIDLDQHRIQVD